VQFAHYSTAVSVRRSNRLDVSTTAVWSCCSYRDIAHLSNRTSSVVQDIVSANDESPDRRQFSSIIEPVIIEPGHVLHGADGTRPHEMKTTVSGVVGREQIEYSLHAIGSFSKLTCTGSLGHGSPFCR
jgi:hypothetical protein